MIEFLIPIKTVTEGNAKEHWRTKAARAKSQRGAARLFGSAQCGKQDVALPCTVTLVRISPGTLDDDNLPGSLKHIRDGIADWLGVDDKHRDAVRYKYDQSKGKPMGVLVTVTPGIAG